MNVTELESETDTGINRSSWAGSHRDVWMGCGMAHCTGQPHTALARG